MTLAELIPRAEWLMNFARLHPTETELYTFVYGDRDVKRLRRIVQTRQLDAGEIDEILTRFEERLPRLVSRGNVN
jgi:hypothetical protein